MDQTDAEILYGSARRLGVKEYAKNISKGQTGYLPFLEGVLKNIEIIYELDLGIVDIPLKKIVGTYTYGRSRSFAGNFMPLLTLKTEFAQKWTALCVAHINEGIRDPIKVYEYMNWFYVVEGNKRVSVLKYYDAYSIPGRVARLVPKRDESDLAISIYYEFLDFYKTTGINLIWFTKRNSFNTLSGYLDNFVPDNNLMGISKYKYFINSVYLPFRKVYLELGGQKLPITTGDAFLEYLTVYGMPDGLDEQELRSRLNVFTIELEQMSGNKEMDIQTIPIDTGEGLISTFTTFVRPKKPLKVAFVYAKDTNTSSWTYAQEMGRSHVNKVFGEAINTSFVDNVPETLEAYDTLKLLADDENDVVFVTSPAFINATLKAAMEFPNTRFLNCSETHSFKHVNTFYGRIYEPRFLAGIAAGSVTKSNVLGYIGTYPIPGVINGINSFALGARMVNPEVTVKVAWINGWDDMQRAKEAREELIGQGVDIISHHDTLSNPEVSGEYGVYTVLSGVGADGSANEYIAAPVWNWGIFYEKMLRNLMNSRRSFGSGQKVINFWWGMDSGIVDFFYSRRLVPAETQKLLDFLKKMIINGTFSPFYGPIYSQDGTLMVKKGEMATREQVVGMDWFVNVVGSELPQIDQNLQSMIW